MTTLEVMNAVRPIFGNVQLSIDPVINDPTRAIVTIIPTSPGQFYGFVQKDELAKALGVYPTNISTPVIMTHVWVENEKKVEPHYEIQVVVYGVVHEAPHEASP